MSDTITGTPIHQMDETSYIETTFFWDENKKFKTEKWMPYTIFKPFKTFSS